MRLGPAIAVSGVIVAAASFGGSFFIDDLSAPKEDKKCTSAYGAATWNDTQVELTNPAGKVIYTGIGLNNLFGNRQIGQGFCDGYPPPPLRREEQRDGLLGSSYSCRGLKDQTASATPELGEACLKKGRTKNCANETFSD